LKKDNLEVIAIIPARTGSKGVKDKNFRKIIRNKSLLDLAVNESLICSKISKIYITTDKKNVHKILSTKNDNRIQFHKRNLMASSDRATANDVIKNVITRIRKESKTSDQIIIYLQPTSPLRTHKHIERALLKFQAAKCDLLISGVKVDGNVYRYYKFETKNRITPLLSYKYLNQNRQATPKIFVPNGAIYIFKASKFMTKDAIPYEDSTFYLMTPQDSLDVDTFSDFELARKLLRA
jgi:CMP-N-acetylneuraminic acid synthetase